MFISMFKVPFSSVGLEQALTDIIEAIAMEETALSNILISEGEIIQKTKNFTGNLDEVISVNESVNSVIKNVVRLQMLLQIKLENTEELLQRIGDIDELEE